MKIKTYNHQTIKLNIDDDNAENYLVLPALIDPHVHFRTPGAAHKEDWQTGSAAAIAGGVTTVFDMPNNTPSITNLDLLEEKIKIIDEQLQNSDIKLHKYFYLGATENNLAEIEKCRNKIIAVKVFMGSSTGDLLVDKLAAQEKIFTKCAELGLMVAVHAEDELTINTNKNNFSDPTIFEHNKIRNTEAAATAVKNAIDLARKTKAKLYILHVSTSAEVALIRAAKDEGLTVFAETTPHHLFLDENAYKALGTLAQMNPPLRTKIDQEALFEALNDGTIDAIGTDHAPHTLAEKAATYPASPSGVPGIETYLPLLLDAYHNGKISLSKIADVTHHNIEKIFGLKPNQDYVVVDLEEQKIIEAKNLKTKCGWSPFAGWKLKGSVKYTILNNKIYKI